MPWHSMLIMFLLLQLFIGVIIENVELLERMNNMAIKPSHLQVRCVAVKNGSACQSGTLTALLALSLVSCFVHACLHHRAS